MRSRNPDRQGVELGAGVGREVSGVLDVLQGIGFGFGVELREQVRIGGWSAEHGRGRELCQ
ncbi:hypothetical protein BBK82_07485 [Lentzea guizhouensis]|uniref:Uncharacterized protein n=1 Tax=Lentzea guizhouensis TaxID=1586287 RepID=A0A1B2HE40_9PSEU|nr:hypothetical protein [Lentzea guizhouensis]ANZ35946.1 hypothetical protein BBK82_07485 [Lentzea guizhouensis]